MIKEIGTLEEDEWIVNFTWVKAHDNNPGNELADLLAKRRPATTAYKQPTINNPKVQRLVI
jgi:ribonuclease HI